MTEEKAARSWIPFFAPPIGPEDIAAVSRTLESGWITRGPRTQEFEEIFAREVGAPAALALGSCTAALHLALLVSDIKPGDEIIAPTMTFCATVNVIEHVGGTPVLVDVERDTLNIDPKAVERAITPRTKAVIVVHYAGHPVDLDAITAIAKRHGLTVIEDAAHAFPARYRGTSIGGTGVLTAFSFYANKNLATGEGGMLTGPAHLVDKARVLSLHGMSQEAWKRFSKGGTWRYDVVVPGFKYNMTDMQASLGISQLKRMDEFQKRRREIFERYDRHFGNSPFVRGLERRDDVESSYHLYIVQLNLGALKIDRDEVIEKLKEQDIGTSVHYIPIHVHTFYANKFGHAPEAFPVAWDHFQRTISLPLFPGMTDKQVDRVAETLLAIASENRA